MPTLCKLEDCTECRKSWFGGMGHIGQVPEEIRTFHQLASRPGVHVMCEIGFNAGHSAAVLLEAKPSNLLFEFDLQNLNYSSPMEAMFKSMYGSRFHLITGSSFDTLPAFLAAGGRCDLISIDGVHDSRVLTDMLNGVKLTGPGGIILVDDVSLEYAGGVVEAWRKMISHGYIRDSTCLTGPFVARVRKEWCYATVVKTTGDLDAEVLAPGQASIPESALAAIKNLKVRGKAVRQHA
jgi:predicted O-methyltransferase YrrM